MKKKDLYSQIQIHCENMNIELEPGEIAGVVHAMSLVLASLDGAELADTLGNFIKKPEKSRRRPSREAINFRNQMRAIKKVG